MSLAWILASAVAAQVGEQSVVAPIPKQDSLSAAELKSAYARSLRSSAKKADPNPYVVVPVLIDLYQQLGDDKTLSHADRSRMRRGLKVRLESLRDRVLRDALAQKKVLQRSAFRAKRAGRKVRSKQLAGGGEIARAVQLIELIQNTIAPDTWDVNGGNGTIRYFSLLKVLVIRQSGEVHHQVGNGLSQLKK